MFHSAGFDLWGWHFTRELHLLCHANSKLFMSLLVCLLPLLILLPNPTTIFAFSHSSVTSVHVQRIRSAPSPSPAVAPKWAAQAPGVHPSDLAEAACVYSASATLTPVPYVPIYTSTNIFKRVHTLMLKRACGELVVSLWASSAPHSVTHSHVKMTYKNKPNARHSRR